MQGDARRHAISILTQLKQSHLKNAFCCYGTQNSVLIGVGKESGLNLVNADTFDAVWADINEYIETNSNNYIFGFIGFDPANQLNKKIECNQQKIDLFVPETVIECKESGCTVLKGEIEHELIREALNQQPHADNTKPIDISDLDLSDLSKQYKESASYFIEAIHAGTLERATLARKINSNRAFDLAETFTSDYSRHEMARSFYFSNEHIAFAGHCPEVLAEGNTRTFATHKLSGTYARDDNVPINELVSRFQSDQRIICEHRSAISTIEDSLAGIGTVQSTKFDVMELPTLLHGWSKFVTKPKENITVANCLRSIFPFGVNPVEPGFELLARYEKFCRGPYYGLTGRIRPGGEFSFTQVLRSAFVDKHNSYLLVGASITGLSTAELEIEETRTKLSTIKIFERTN